LAPDRTPVSFRAHSVARSRKESLMNRFWQVWISGAIWPAGCVTHSRLNVIDEGQENDMGRTGALAVMRAGEKAGRPQHMTQIALLAVFAFSLAIYAAGALSKEPGPIPPELIPAGFTAADCHITKPGGPIVEEDADGHPRTVGKRPPKVECSKHTEGRATETHTASCRTKAGKGLPLSDCCLNTDGSMIPACKLKPQQGEQSTPPHLPE
jgi:hypothetical protein